MSLLAAAKATSLAVEGIVGSSMAISQLRAYLPKVAASSANSTSYRASRLSLWLRVVVDIALVSTRGDLHVC